MTNKIEEEKLEKKVKEKWIFNEKKIEEFKNQKKIVNEEIEK